MKFTFLSNAKTANKIFYSALVYHVIQLSLSPLRYIRLWVICFFSSSGGFGWVLRPLCDLRGRWELLESVLGWSAPDEEKRFLVPPRNLLLLICMVIDWYSNKSARNSLWCCFLGVFFSSVLLIPCCEGTWSNGPTLGFWCWVCEHNDLLVGAGGLGQDAGDVGQQEDTDLGSFFPANC